MEKSISWEAAVDIAAFIYYLCKEEPSVKEVENFARTILFLNHYDSENITDVEEPQGD